MSCRAALADVTDDREYATAFDRYEFLRAMLEIYYTWRRVQRSASSWAGSVRLAQLLMPARSTTSGRW